MSTMKETETDSVFTPEVMAELQKLADDAAKGIRDPERMRQAAERMDRTREEIFRRIGLVDFAVPTIRATPRRRRRMRVVLDSCVGLKWFLAEKDSAKALVLRDEFMVVRVAESEDAAGQDRRTRERASLATAARLGDDGAGLAARCAVQGP